ncbi:hypothetical protein N9Y81_01765 [Akkermansiaceae bacterium]|nr:hypothetical protein [Akkermansiaceae bacterium]
MTPDGNDQAQDHPCHFSRENGGDLIVSAADHLRGVLSPSGGPYWKANTPRQKACLKEWGRNLGLLLTPDTWINDFQKGGQEHDFYDPRNGDRIFKLTRDGVFGLTPGIELALVASGEDARRFHLWEASPIDYLERLHLQNLFTLDLNRLEGLVFDSEELSILTSQPRFEINPVSQEEIDEWFISLGFKKVTTAAYYREADNLGIFDAHDKNVVRASDTLVPFDIIPCHPDEGFLDFIQDSLEAGSTLSAVRTTR